MKVWIANWDDRPPEAYLNREALEEAIIKKAGFGDSIDELVQIHIEDGFEAQVGEDHIYFDDWMMAELVEVIG